MGVFVVHGEVGESENSLLLLERQAEKCILGLLYGVYLIYDS